MADPTMLQKLAAMLRMGGGQTGGGMLGQSAQAMQLAPAYREYAMQAQSNGQQPLPMAQWAQQQQAAAQPQPAPQPQQAEAAPAPFRF